MSLLAGVAASAAMLLPAAAGAAVVGPKDVADTGNSYGCFIPALDCTFANLKLASGVGEERSPITGTITKWRAAFSAVPSGGGPFRLQVLRRTDNPPGLAADRFEVLRESGDAFVGSPGTHAFLTSLRIREGDFIAFASDIQIPFISFNEVPGNKFGEWDSVLAPGDESPPGQFPEFSEYLLYNATVRG